MPIAILGTGRSGTSMIARMLNLSGMYMGEEEGLWNKNLDPQMNPTGFWEQREVHALMEQLFDHLGGTWENPPCSLLDGNMIPHWTRFIPGHRILLSVCSASAKIGPGNILKRR